MEIEDRILSILRDIKRKSFKSNLEENQQFAPKISTTYKYLREVKQNAGRQHHKRSKPSL